MLIWQPCLCGSLETKSSSSDPRLLFSTMNQAEQWVYRLCRESFLSLWSYANPRRRNGKELCDVLVVCDPDIVLISVKNTQLPDDGDVEVNQARWSRRAIDDSMRQLYGSERELKTSTQIIRSDGTPGLPYPSSTSRRVHRIAVALGSKGRALIPSGNNGRGFVHVFDDKSTNIVLQELDTISDFVAFLNFVEDLQRKCPSVIVFGGYEDVLGFYVLQGRKLPEACDELILDNGFWEEARNRPEFIARKDEDKISYFWDHMIEILSQHLSFALEGPPPSLEEAELVVRTMAKETRFNRRVLAKSFIEFHMSRQARSRIVRSLSGIVYVFLVCSRETERVDRRNELAARCLVARGLNPDVTTVVGIATETYDPSSFSLDVVHLHIPIWTEEDERRMSRLQREAKLFAHTSEKRITEHEYPERAEQ